MPGMGFIAKNMVHNIGIYLLKEEVGMKEGKIKQSCNFRKRYVQCRKITGCPLENSKSLILFQMVRRDPEKVL